MSNPNKIHYTSVLSVDMVTDGEPGTDDVYAAFERGCIELLCSLRNEFPEASLPAELIPFAMSATPEKI